MDFIHSNAVRVLLVELHNASLHWRGLNKEVSLELAGNTKLELNRRRTSTEKANNVTTFIGFFIILTKPLHSAPMIASQFWFQPARQ